MENKENSGRDEANPSSAPRGESMAKGPEMAKAAERIVFRVPARHNPRLLQVIDRVNADAELYTLWQVVNVNAVQRLRMKRSWAGPRSNRHQYRPETAETAWRSGCRAQPR